MLPDVRKRPLDSGGAAPLPGAVPALPQLSTSRTLEALAAGDPNGKPAPVRLIGTPPVLCKFFLRNACQKGNSCTFSHEVQGLPAVPIDRKLRTPCRFYELGQCMRGQACKFAHGDDELEQISRSTGKKKARTETVERQPEGVDNGSGALAALSAARGFQDFSQFDPEMAGPTDLEARAAQEREAEGEGMDDVWAAFLEQVGDESTDGGGDTSGQGAAAAVSENAEQEAPGDWWQGDAAGPHPGYAPGVNAQAPDEERGNSSVSWFPGWSRPLAPKETQARSRRLW